MTPYLKLGPWDAPSFDLMPWDANPIVALLVEQHSPLEENDFDSVVSFLQVNGLYLDEMTEGFFLKFESVCKLIIAGKLTTYDPARLEASEFADWVKNGTMDGTVTVGVKMAAKGFLDFLANHPSHWPLQAGNDRQN